MRSLLPLCIASAAWLSGCAHTVPIHSDPPGAKVIVDGDDMGPAPVKLSESSGFFKSHQVRVEQKGYSPVETSILQTIPVWPVVAPSVCLAPVTLGGSCFGLMWGLRYGSSYEYKLSRIGEDDGTSAPATVDELEDKNATIPY